MTDETWIRAEREHERERKPLIERALDKIAKHEDGCWEWTGSKRSGYGTVWSGGGDGRSLNAHRVVYEALVGPIPDGMELDHLCRNRACVRPDHLEPVVHRLNVIRGDAPTSVNAAKTHCHQGHPLSGDNLRIENSGSRRCRECAAAGKRRYRAEKKAKSG